MTFARCVILMAALGCGLMVMEAGGSDKRPSLDDARIKAVVAHFAKNGVKLETAKDGGWMVADPKGDGYEVIVYLRTFPPDATEKEMRDKLQMVNLAHHLNVPSRLAMSYPGLRHTDPAKKAPKLDQIPVVAKLEKLFKEYRPAEGMK